MQLAVAGVDTERAVKALQNKWRNEASQAELAAAQHVVDLNAATIACPACETSFPNPGPNTERVCPNCGLYL